MAVQVLGSHISLDDSGTAWIEGTSTKVIEVAMDRRAYGWGAEEIRRQHPNLSLAQIHAALSHYYDNEAAMNSEIESVRRDIEVRRGLAGASPFAERMEAEGRLT
jgi:uncharacterized protein (DUF433 family)